jgi:eukaryotic-like serine/threonine-protein kinase
MSEEQSQSGPADGERGAAPASGGSGPMTCLLCSATYPAGTRFCPVDGSVLRPESGEDDSLVGRIIDERYYLVEKLGEGGMGDVYLGEHVRTHRRCAVKVVNRRTAADPEALGRFIREATNAGRVHHANVATLYDFGEGSDGLTYLAMEYVDGEPLSRILAREGALPPARAADMARQIAEGVGAAHELGIVHRDLKPSNIIVAKDRKGADVVKVVDFGISRAPSLDAQHLTRTGIVIGTPEYMSPEQLIGDPVDGRSDIYSLGCILYQMLTGEQAFGGSTAQFITRRLTERPPHAREKNPDIPKALDELITTALGRTPPERFQSMEELRNALLAAPTQPVATGPRRLDAWVRQATGSGLAVEPPTTDEPEGRTAAGPLPPEPAPDAVSVEAAAAETALPGEAEESFPADLATTGEPDVPTKPEGETGEVEAAADTEPSFAADTAEGGDAGDVDPDTGAEVAPRRRRVLVPVLAAAAVVLLVAVVGLFNSQDSSAPEEEPVATPEPAPVPVLEPGVVEALWQELAAAEADEFEDRYSSALARLRDAETVAAGLLVTFPDDARLVAIMDSMQGQTSQTLMRCESARQVEIRRNQPPPVCEPAEPPPPQDAP